MNIYIEYCYSDAKGKEILFAIFIFIIGRERKLEVSALESFRINF
jgi:hypothetical protein